MSPAGSGRYKRQTVSFGAFEVAVNTAERRVQSLFDPLDRSGADSMMVLEVRQIRLRGVMAALGEARRLRARLTDKQWDDPRYACLRARLELAERVQRTGENPLGVVQLRVEEALSRLDQEPDNPLSHELRSILSGLREQN